MAKLAAVVDSLDGVAEAHRDLYVKGEGDQAGKFVLDADVESHPAVAGLKSTVKSTRQEREDARAALKAFKDLGYTPEQIAEIKRKAEAGAGDKGDEDFERRVAKRVKEALDKVQPDLDELPKVRAENRKLKLTDKVRGEFILAGGFDEDADDVVRLTEGRFDLDKNGKVVVLDDDGEATSLTPKEWFEKTYKKQKPKLFKGTDASGSGARGGSGAGGSGYLAELEKLTPAQRLTRLRQEGAKT